MDQEIDSKIKPRFSPNGSSVLAVSRDKGVILTDGKTARILRHDASLQSVAFSADGNRILTSCTDGSIRVWDSTGKKLLEIYLEGRISSVSFSPDGAEVLATGGDAIARIFNLYSLAETRSAAADLRLEPLTPVERQRLQVFESGLDVDSMDPIK
jgi:WD40 repeat protein